MPATRWDKRVDAGDWQSIAAAVDDYGGALLPRLLTPTEAKRLRNPRPECFVTLAGLPIAFGKFQWPFHRSTSGADTYIVHGEMRLADGSPEQLHAKAA